MPAYHQMGHNTENLVGETDLNEFAGIVLSPLNREHDELSRHIEKFRELGTYDIVFDPQLYFPRTERERLRDYPYFPADFDTADLSSLEWWNQLANNLDSYCSGLAVDAIASPVTLPNVFDEDYYSRCIEVTKILTSKTRSYRVLTSALVRFEQLGNIESVMRIASILTNVESDGFYIVIASEINPRYEFSDDHCLSGLMYLVNQLKNAGYPVLVSHCSSDMILFKLAGAESCASGKFFNLRRFGSARYDIPAGGGGQLPYWFEHGLLAFIRASDLLRIKDANLDAILKQEYSDNYWAAEIEKNLEQPWLGLAWRHYMSWYGKTEKRLSEDDPANLVPNWLKAAEENWLLLEDNDVLMDEPRNNGSWVRRWRQAISRFQRLVS